MVPFVFAVFSMADLYGGPVSRTQDSDSWGQHHRRVFPLRLCFGLFGSKAALPMARIQIGRICSCFHFGFGQDDWINLRSFSDHIKIGPTLFVLQMCIYINPEVPRLLSFCFSLAFDHLSLHLPIQVSSARRTGKIRSIKWSDDLPWSSWNLSPLLPQIPLHHS